MLVNRALNSFFKIKIPVGVGSLACYSEGGVFNERLPIGNREWVGYGVNSMPNYVDCVEEPMPAVRFREIKGDLLALREKEKGDWKKLTIEEKKTLYRTSFCQTFEEVNAPTGEWKSTLGFTLLLSSFGIWIFILQKLFVLNELPDSFKDENRREQFRKMLVNRDGHLTGISSKWDYEKDDWK